MKKFNLVLSIIALLIAGITYAQDTQNKWLIGVGAHAVDYTSVRGTFDGFFDINDYSIAPPLSKLSVSRSLNRSFALDLEASIGEIDNKRLKIKDEFYILAGLGLRYKFTNGYILKETSWFDPYLRVGANYHKYDYTQFVPGQPSYNEDETKIWDPSLDQPVDPQENNIVVNGGVGVNFWLTQNFGLNVESQYNWLPAYEQDYFNHFQHSVSAVFKFGAPKPEPKIVDPCEGKGGDTDGDTVCDIEDECPTVFGLVTLKGCPEKVDPCKDKGGDTDGDGICDADDKCPNDAKNDSDGDGVCDNEDKCPNEFGIKELQGCPDDSEVITTTLKGLLFDVNKSSIKVGQEKILDDVFNVISKNDNNYYVDGHTDSDGKAAYNLTLSQKRANSVVNELVKRGIPADRLTARGFGESAPACPGNVDAACKQENRRVEFYNKAAGKAPADFIAPIVKEVKKTYKKAKKGVKKTYKKVKKAVKKAVK